MLTLLAAAAMVLSQHLQHSVEVVPGAIEEPCVSLQKNDRIEFSFSADQVLDFNLHYHAESVVFPADYSAIASHTGSYIAPAARQYCLMWTNKQSGPVKLDYEYRIYTSQEDK